MNEIPKEKVIGFDAKKLQETQCQME